MRRILLPWMAFVLLLGVPLFAQRGGGGHGGGGHAGGGFGGMHSGGAGFRSSGFGGGFHSGFGGGFRGSSNGGFRRGFGGFRGGFGFGRFSNFYYYPYAAYPAFYGGYYDPYFADYSYPDPYAYSGATYYSQPSTIYSPPPSPTVIEVQPQAQPAPQPSQSRQYEDPLYLLAFRDGTIRAVLAYWAEGAAVHYVSMDHEQKQAPLASIDRDLSERLNRERGVTFQLPR